MILSSAAVAAPPSPTDDPFYVAPAGFGSTAPGTVLRSREVHVSLGPVPLSVAFTAYQSLYRTTDAGGRPVATVTTVLVPKTSAPVGGRGLLSVNTAEDSVDPAARPPTRWRPDRWPTEAPGRCRSSPRSESSRQSF